MSDNIWKKNDEKKLTVSVSTYMQFKILQVKQLNFE